MSETPNTDKLQETLVSAAGQEAFVTWFADPMTQAVLAAAREQARPVAVYTPDALVIVTAYGESVGANKLLDFMQRPWRRGPQTDEAGNSKPAPKPTYGADGLLKETEDA